MLRSEQWGFDELRAELGLTVKVLEEDLRHIQRSVRSGGERLSMHGARCAGCDFQFSTKALHPPGRCPQCRDRRIDGPWFEIVG
jgi:predicted Zn-ribbon and HTH transcriptional regulator